MDAGWMGAGMVAMFAWLAVESWVNGRRKEREALYRNEAIRRTTESAAGAEGAIQFLREEERISRLKWREGLKLIGLIFTAAGVGFGYFMFLIERGQPVWSLAMVPVLIGIAILTYVYLLAQKQ